MIKYILYTMLYIGKVWFKELVFYMKYLLNFGDRVQTLFQNIAYIGKWMVWYTKYLLNFNDGLHAIRISLQPVNANPEDAVYNITVQGNGIAVQFNQIEINQEIGNGIQIVQTEANGVLPLDISTMIVNRNGNDGDSEWFFRWIEIDGGNRFSFHKIITQEGFSSRKDTLLPQDEGSRYHRDLRTFDLAEQRLKYGYGLYNCHDTELPVKIANLPMEENFSFCYVLTNSIIPTAGMLLSEGYIMFKMLLNRFPHLPGRWRLLEEINTAYQIYFKAPRGNINWEDDQHFALQRLNQCNSSLIRRVNNIDQIADIMNNLPNGVLNAIVDVNAAIEGHQLYFTNINVPEGLAIPSPVVLFERTNDDNFLPVAINLNVAIGGQFVFQPDDEPNAWRLAKMWANLADASMQLSVTHLGLTHVLMEGIAICVHRNLSSRHPIYKLLVPHFYYNLAINELARETLFIPGGYLDNTMNIHSTGVLQLIRQRLGDWNMNIDGTFPRDLENRGLTGDDGVNQVNIPGFFYAEDGLQLYNAIHNYVDQYVHHYYSGVNDEDILDRLLGDTEIQAFYAELVLPRGQENGGIGIQGVRIPGDNDRFWTTGQLIDTLTSTIFICSVMHAATNFPQYDQYGFPPNYSTLLHGAPPLNANGIEDQAVLDCLPSVRETFDIMTNFTLLSQETTQPLGQSEVQLIEDPNAVTILNTFRAELALIEQEINDRNQEIIAGNLNPNFIPYTRLLPSNIPNSIAI
ncbi:polyunsaturated fatty acid lipoxygenase ALOX15B-like [Mytilus californianus]|uniref:polyunsaturated fatty acid lipoxygenase ALOX15B-like n=1 Tax=Mytilus californianus TaxID=6549 RepID=UPI0022451D18|nr:polyunsaturated fatty acid lipoxygenase ALOX15B-like [Mytilus californianus]